MGRLPATAPNATPLPIVSVEPVLLVRCRTVPRIAVVRPALVARERVVTAPRVTAAQVQLPALRVMHRVAMRKRPAGLAPMLARGRGLEFGE
jgi:hypothetical protein